MAQGFHLALEETPFFEDEIKAWQYAPVVRVLYDHICDIKNADDHKIEQEQEIDIEFNERQIDILDVVFDKYSQLGYWHLAELTHKDGTPWEQTYEEGHHKIIEPELIKQHFEENITNNSFVILLSEVRGC